MILPGLSNIRTNVHVNLIFNIQADPPNLWIQKVVVFHSFVKRFLVHLPILFTLKFTLLVFWLLKVTKVTSKEFFSYVSFSLNKQKKISIETSKVF